MTTKTHLHWIKQERERNRPENPRDWTLFDYTYRELATALKRFLGRADDYCVLYYIVDKESLYVLFEKKWILVFKEQLYTFS